MSGECGKGVRCGADQPGRWAGGCVPRRAGPLAGRFNAMATLGSGTLLMAANGALGVLVFMRPLCFSTSAFAGVRMLKEAVGESQGSVPVFPVVLRDRPPVGILIRSAS